MKNETYILLEVKRQIDISILPKGLYFEEIYEEALKLIDDLEIETYDQLDDRIQGLVEKFEVLSL